MRTRKPLFWILRHNDDGRFLCVDGKRRHFSPVEMIKRYVYLGNAMKRARSKYTAHAVHEGDTLDACGVITTSGGWKR